MSAPTPSEQARRKWRRTVVQSMTSSLWSSWMVPTEFVMGLRMLASHGVGDGVNPHATVAESQSWEEVRPGGVSLTSL